MSKTKLKIPEILTDNVRMQALYIVYQVKYKQGYSNLLMQKTPIKGRDLGLLTEIVYGTLSKYDYLKYLLTPFVKNKKLDDWVEVLLLTALFQMCRLDRVPEHAIINESVRIAKIVGNVGISKFVNGVLRQIQRKGINKEVAITEPIERLSILGSMPKWLIEKLITAYGIAEVEKLIASLDEPSKVSARLTDVFADREAIIAELKTEGYDVRASQVSPVGIVGKKGHLAASQAFLAGKLTMQDESSMLVAPNLDLQPNSQVLDACAAPGGKTTHIASYLDAAQGGSVTALDIHRHKLKLIEDNAKRLQVADTVVTKLLDARNVDEEFGNESFDRILVDAPCSGLGLMRRKPEIKFGKEAKDLEKLSQIQLDILTAVAPLLKKGGKLVYSTCTILPTENEEVVRTFLAKHSDFELIPVQGLENLNKAQKDGMCILLPHMYMTDGFFISVLQKKGG